jgi:transcription elongation GreA/GreB family factor
MSENESVKKSGVNMPAVPERIHALISAGDFDSIDMEFLTASESLPIDTDFLVGTLRGVVKSKKTRQAQELLDVLVQVVGKKDNVHAEGAVARQILAFWPDCKEARTMLLSHLRREHGTKPNFEKFVEHCRFSANEESARTLETLETWLRFDIGTPVYMQTKGVGRVSEFNLSLKTLKVNFSGEFMSFRISEAGRLLEPLVPGHFLRDKIENAEQLKQLAADDPGEILRRIFASLRRPLSSAELKELMSGIVPAQSWTSWWGKARGDTRLIIGSGARSLCTWSDSAHEVDTKLCEEFNKADDRKKIELARKYLGRSAEITKVITSGIMTVASEAAKNDPAFALEIAMTLEGKIPSAELSSTGASPNEILQRFDISGLFRKIPDKTLRRKLVTQIKVVREDWPDVFLSILKQESDLPTIEMLFDALSGEGGAGKETIHIAVQSAIAVPAGAPGFFTWICRSIPESKELKEYAGLALIKAAVTVLGSASFKEFHASIRKSFDGGQSCRIAIGALDAEQANEVRSIFERDVGLEPFRREEFVRDLDVTFPRVKEPESEVFYATAAAIAEKQEEFRHIVQHDLPKNRDEIVKAKAFGDLKENFEYHAARARQEMLSSRAKTLGDQLTLARVIEPMHVETSRVNVGTTVRMIPSGTAGDDVVVTILGPWDSDPAKNILSHLAPAATALMGAQIGDEREYHGDLYLIKEIKPWA